MPSDDMDHPKGEVTLLLEAWSQGDRQALNQLMPLVIDELHSMAARLFRREAPDNTLQPTAVVSELFLRFKERRSVSLRDREHFKRVAAQMMRRLLVDHARTKKAAKRGGSAARVPAIDIPICLQSDPEDLIALNDGLKHLANMEPRQAQVLELKFFAGLTNEEIAKILEIGLTTVKKDLRVAKAWLRRELRQKPEDSGDDEDDSGDG